MKVWYQLYFGSDRIGRATQAEVEENINVDDFCQVVLEKRAKKLKHVDDAADLNVFAPNADPNDSDAAQDPRKALQDFLQSNEDILIVKAPPPQHQKDPKVEKRRRVVKGVKKEEENPKKKEEDIEDDRPEQVVSKAEANSGGNDIQLEPPSCVSSSSTTGRDANNNEERVRTTPPRRSKRTVSVTPDGPTSKRRKSEDAVVESKIQIEDNDRDDPPPVNQPDEIACTIASQQSNDAEGQGTDEPTVKVEKVRLEIKEQRKYGDRFLIGRHQKDGIPRLGGNWQGTNPYPKPDHPRHTDLAHLGEFSVFTLNDLWNPLGPQYAGQPTAVLSSCIEDGDASRPFAVFMRRALTSRALDATTQGRLIGWEYCGQYEVIPKNDGVDEIDDMWTNATMVPPVTKAHIAKDMKRYASFASIFTSWRKRLDTTLAKDNSPAAPLFMIEGRMPTEEERKEPQAPLAARARALGYRRGVSDDALMELLVELDEFYSDRVVRFVEYSEDIYDYIKRGISDKRADGKKATNGDNVKASDWYAFFDQQVIY
jgi:hypothetical protein